MTKISTFLLLFLVGIGFNTAFGQDPTPLYVGQKSGSLLTAVDTTDLTFSVISTVGMSSDFGSVQGLYGISLDPISEEMYVLYESTGGNGGNRRLGTLDAESGSITDVGEVGAYNDIDFNADGTLYAMGNNWDGLFDIAEVNTATGASTTVYDPPSASWGTTMCYDPFGDRLIRADRSSVFFVDPVAMTQSTLGGSGGETHAMAVLDENTMVTARYGNRYIVDLTTGTQTFSGGWGFNVHALGFGAVPCAQLDITVSATELCVDEEFTLTAVSESGATITWTGGIDNGEPFIPGPPGVYEYTPMSDDELDCITDPVSIEVIGLPTVLAGAGDLVFCEDEMITLSAAGDADLYIWNFGDALELMPGVGTYTFDLLGLYTEGGCLGENDDEVTVEVVGLPTISASASDDLICVNQEVFLTGAGGEMYWWDNSVLDGEAYIPGTLGTTTYTVFGTDENGCSSMATVDVEVVDNIVIAATSVDIETLGDDGAIDIEVSGGAPTYTYDWDNDGITGDFDDTQDLTGLSFGTYTVVVRGTAGCEAERTFDLASQVGIDDLNAANVAVYPNPTTEFVNIEFTGTFNYELVAINGDILVTGNATDKKVLNLKEFADGIYFVNIANETATATIKLVKK